ncbi:MAG: transcription termination/antitermination protein NusA [Chloroflexi bacterium]|nr:transcription termination/antitermination protein NusA [Chloroflexota bacterium]
MKSDFTLAFNEIVETRALPKEVVLDALAQALVSAYRRDSNISSSQRVEAHIDPTGQSQIFLEKEVTDIVNSEQTEVLLEAAREFFPEVEIGDMVMMPVKTKASFGRIAAQTAKQVILQRIREAERESLYEEFVEREGDLVSGTVQSVTSGAITLSLGRAEAIMPRNQQIPGERYRHHDKVRAFVMEVKKNSRGPQIVVSRAHKNMLRRLLEYEVPEVYNGQVEIKNIAREAGHRSKIAVAALQEGVDPVGACVGMRGIRIQNIVKELSDEKIDVIEWNPDPAIFIAKALSPARVSDMLLEEDFDTGRTATVIVPDDQLSLAIGREGQNARLAAKLTGWRIDIKSVSEAAQEAFAVLDQPPLLELQQQQQDLVAEVLRIMEKKASNRPVQPEEYRVLTDFVKVAERRLLDVREEARADRRAQMDLVRDLVPDRAFQMQIKELELDDDINRALSRVDNVGDLMIRMLVDEPGLGQTLKQGGAGDDAMEAIRYALDDLVILSRDEPQPEPDAEVEAEAEAVAEAVVEPEPEPAPMPPGLVGESLADVVAEDAADEVPEAEAEAEIEALPAFVEPEPEPAPAPEPVAQVEPAPAAPAAVEPEPEPDPVGEVAPAQQPESTPAEWSAADGFDDYDDDDLDEEAQERERKKAKRKRRQLIFDEERGEVVARRRRKGSRKRDEWDDYLD